MARLRIEGFKEGRTRIFIDDKEIIGATSYAIHQDPTSLPDLELHFTLTELEIDGKAVALNIADR